MPITRATGTTGEIVNVYFEDNRNTSSLGMVNISSSSIGFSWMRNNQATISSGTCSSNTTLGTWSTAALLQISSTSSRGWYQFGCPDGALVSGRSVVLKLFSLAGQAGVQPANIEIDLLGSVAPVSVSAMSLPVGVSSIAVGEKLVGVSTIAVGEKLVGVSTIAASQKLVGVSTLTTPAGVSSIAVAEKLVGVSTIAVSEKLVGVSTLATQVHVSTMSVTVGVSSMATSVDVSSASVLLGVSTLATSVDVSSSIMVSSNTVQLNGFTVQGDGTAGNLWRG